MPNQYSHLSFEDKVKIFWSRVDKPNGEDGCWVWTGCKNTRGYGKTYIGGKCYLTHRLSYILAHGEIPNRMHVCHTCDFPSCVNPKHLWLGTAKENAIDRSKKNRQFIASNELHGQCKLTNGQVAEIRAKYAKGTVTYRELAAEYDVTPSHLCSIVRGKLRTAKKNEGKHPQVKEVTRSVGYRTKIPFSTVEQIRRRYAEGGITYRDLVSEYGISLVSVYRIIRGISRTRE